MWTRSQLKANGKQLFKRNYWSCVGAAVIMALLGGGSAGGSGSTSTTIEEYSTELSHMDQAMLTMIILIAIVVAIAAIAFRIFVGGAVEVGGAKFFIDNRTEMVPVGTVFSAFKSGHYGNVIKTIFLRDLYVALWTCLLIIPGIIKSLEYLMVPYILAENPGMDRREAFAISKRMMDGQKMAAFWLSLSFIGWEMLSALSCGLVGIFYVNPYVKATYAELYAFNKIKAYNEGYIQ